MSEELEAVVMRCLEKNVKRRWQSVSELAVALEPFRSERSLVSIGRIVRLSGGPAAPIPELEQQGRASSSSPLPGLGSATDGPVTTGASARGAKRSRARALLAIADGGIQGGPATSFRLTNATLAGRAPARQVVIAAGLLQAAGIYVCNSLAFPLVKAAVCSAADTVLDTNLDLLGLPCDAVSVAARFEAVPALVGSERSRTARAPCGADWANQNCE